MYLIYYLFYKTHRYFYRAQGMKDGAFIAMISLSCSLGFNLMTVLMLFEAIQLFPIIEHTKMEFSILGLTLFVFNYFFFFSSKRYELIYKRFENEPKNKKIIGTLFAWLYYLLSFIIFAFVSILRYDLIHH